VCTSDRWQTRLPSTSATVTISQNPSW